MQTKQTAKLNFRNTSIEIMRLVSMVLIVIHHLIGQGLGFQFYCGGGKYANIENWTPIIIMESFCIVGVNLFILISGYYSIKLRSKSVIKFLFVVLGFVLFHVLVAPLYDTTITLKHSLCSILFFFSGNTAWFVKSYFILMLSTMIINPALEKISKRQLLTVLCILLYVNIYLGFFRLWDINENGYTVSHMILMYIIGCALRKFDFPCRFRRLHFLMGYVGFSIILAVVMIVCLDKISGNLEFHLLGYNNPLIIFSSVSLFCYFSKFKFYSKNINFLLSGIFGIYLFHQYHPFWCDVMIPAIRSHYENYGLNSFVFYCIGLIVLIVVIGSALNLVLNKILNVLLEKTFAKNACVWLDSKFGL